MTTAMALTEKVSTHSRSKAAAVVVVDKFLFIRGFNSQPLEGGCPSPSRSSWVMHSFNSQPLEGGCAGLGTRPPVFGGFNSQPLEGGCPPNHRAFRMKRSFQLTAARRRLQEVERATLVEQVFQLTAARRRLRATAGLYKLVHGVSTHSRSKAAAWGNRYLL